MDGLEFPQQAHNAARQKIAVIGAGVSGLSCAWALSRHHEVVLYEADSRLGGHANTRTISVGGREIEVDTGFIVYNEPTYPNLTALFAPYRRRDRSPPKCPFPSRSTAAR